MIMDQIKEHEFCLRCGRKLKNPVARKNGYGAVCEKKLRVADQARLFGVKVKISDEAAAEGEI